jgi:hypothetical protein
LGEAFDRIGDGEALELDLASAGETWVETARRLPPVDSARVATYALVRLPGWLVAGRRRRVPAVVPADTLVSRQRCLEFIEQLVGSRSRLASLLDRGCSSA